MQFDERLVAGDDWRRTACCMHCRFRILVDDEPPFWERDFDSETNDLIDPLRAGQRPCYVFLASSLLWLRLHTLLLLMKTKTKIQIRKTPAATLFDTTTVLVGCCRRDVAMRLTACCKAGIIVYHTSRVQSADRQFKSCCNLYVVYCISTDAVLFVPVVMPLSLTFMLLVAFKLPVVFREQNWRDVDTFGYVQLMIIWEKWPSTDVRSGYDHHDPWCRSSSM